MACDAERRAFLRALTTTTVALAVGRCGEVSGPKTTSLTTGSTGSTTSGNLSPVWASIPTITFTQGVASSFSIASYVSDPNGDPLTVTRNFVTLPAGVTYDAAGQRFVYDGVGAVGSASGVGLTADDGRP